VFVILGRQTPIGGERPSATNDAFDAPPSIGYVAMSALISSQ
jgi:hypothetical protein